MARYAKVDVRVWDDEKVREMSPIPPCGQGLWIHLLVSRHRSSIPGLLCVGEAALAEEFGWSLKAFREAFAEASSKGLVKADWKARVVWIPNAYKFNGPESPNVVKSWRIPWDETPDCPLKLQAFETLKAFVDTLKKGFGEAFTKACRKPSGKPSPIQEPDPEPDPETVSLTARGDDDGRSSGCETSGQGECPQKTAYDWRSFFASRWWQKRGRQYGQGEADAKASARLDEFLGSLPADERAKDWEARERMVQEFLGRSDRATTESGWSFSFFASGFQGLRIPPGERPAPQAQTGNRQPQPRANWGKPVTMADVEAARKKQPDAT